MWDREKGKKDALPLSQNICPPAYNNTIVVISNELSLTEKWNVKLFSRNLWIFQILKNFEENHALSWKCLVFIFFTIVKYFPRNNPLKRYPKLQRHTMDILWPPSYQSHLIFSADQPIFVFPFIFCHSSLNVKLPLFSLSTAQLLYPYYTLSLSHTRMQREKDLPSPISLLHLQSLSLSFSLSHTHKQLF